MRGSTRWTMATVMVAGMVGITIAQQPRPGGGGGGFGGGGGLTSLIRSKTVREDLKITDEQGKKLQEWNKEFGPKIQEMTREKMKDIPREQFREKFAAIQAEIAAETEKGLATVVSAEQIKRLKEIDIQVAGSRAISRADVQTALKMTDEQKEKLRTIGEDSFKAMGELREEYGIRGFGGTRLEEAKQKEYDTKLATITKESQAKTEGVLTDEQKKTLKDLAGATIDVAKVREETRPQFGPGGGRPGGNRPQPKKDN